MLTITVEAFKVTFETTGHVEQESLLVSSINQTLETLFNLLFLQVSILCKIEHRSQCVHFFRKYLFYNIFHY